MKNFTIPTIVLLLITTGSFKAIGQWGSSYRFSTEKKAAAAKQAKQDSSEALVVATAPKNNTRSAKISIMSDLSQSATGGGETKTKIGNGRLGIAFVTEHFYGDISFAVFTNDRSQATGALTEPNFFYNNLLLAQNQSGGINEVAGSLGISNLVGKLLDDDTPHWYNNFGLHCQFRSSNQLWEKDDQKADIVLHSFSLLASYQMFNFSINDDNWSRMQLFGYGGFTTRRLGGNYSLDKNKALREYFLGTDKYVFNGMEYGLRLELGPFYGQAFFTNFKAGDNIDGFSGPQLAVKLGALVTLDLNGSY